METKQESVKDGWQPIERAPKDGTRVLVANSEYAWIEIAWWEQPNWIYGDSDYGSCDCSPTHWMNLPEPPKQ
jgi:hypothetical protein